MKTTSFRFILAALAATAALVGCTKEITPNFENDKVNSEGSRVIAVSFASQTKTILDGFQPKFANKDSILISNGEALDTCEVKVDGKGATISTNLTGPLKAVYPYKAAKLDGNNPNQIDTVFVSPVQSGTFADANICMAKDITNEAVFENKTAVLRFYVGSEIEVTSITLKSLSESFAPNIGTKITVEAPDGKTLYDQMPENQDRRVCYVAVPYGMHEQLTITTAAKNQTPEPKNLMKCSLAAGSMYTVFIPYYIEVDGQKWGYCNIGAFLPEEPGDYFAWGEVNGHKADTSKQVVEGEPGEYSYIMDAFAADFKGFDFTDTERYTGEVDRSKGFSNKNTPYYLNLDGGFSKYTDSNSVTLQSSDDAATTNWGGGWRMPTKDEFETLINGTSTDENDFVGGGLKIRGTELLFPAVGFADNMNLTLYAELDSKLYYSGFYWSSTLYSSSVDCAWHLDLLSDYRVQLDYGLRQIGGSIRPIYGPAPTPTEPTSEYVEIAADYDNDPNTANTTLKWYRQNLAITTSGNKSWKGGNESAVKVPGTDDDVIVGDYFQWGTYKGYCGDATAADKGLLIYESFTNKYCVNGGSEDKFEFKTTEAGIAYQFNTSWSEDSTSVGISPYFDGSKGEYGEYTKYTGTDDAILASSDDVANIILGENWRMPTSAEFKAMKKATYWVWDSDDMGYYVYAPASGDEGGLNGKQSDGETSVSGTYTKSDALLFFPAAGSGYGTDLNAGDFGYYWSGSLGSSYTDYAYGLYFYYSVYVNLQGYYDRYSGLSVRPVSD